MARAKQLAKALKLGGGKSAQIVEDIGKNATGTAPKMKEIFGLVDNALGNIAKETDAYTGLNAKGYIKQLGAGIRGNFIKDTTNMTKEVGADWVQGSIEEIMRRTAAQAKRSGKNVDEFMSDVSKKRVDRDLAKRASKRGTSDIGDGHIDYDEVYDSMGGNKGLFKSAIDEKNAVSDYHVEKYKQQQNANTNGNGNSYKKFQGEGRKRVQKGSPEETTPQISDEAPTSSQISPEERRAKRNEFARENQAYKDKANIENDAKSGVRYGRGEDADRAIFNKTKSMSKGAQHLVDREEAAYNAHAEAIKSAEGQSEIGKRLKINGYENMSTRQMREAVYQHHAKNIGKGPTMMNHIIGNKVPQKAAGGLITAGVVGSMFSSRGQQSNAQLYNQSPGPGQ